MGVFGGEGTEPRPFGPTFHIPARPGIGVSRGKRPAPSWRASWKGRERGRRAELPSRAALPPPQLAAPPVPGSSPARGPGHFLLPRPASSYGPQAFRQRRSYRLCDLRLAAKRLCAHYPPPPPTREEARRTRAAQLFVNAPALLASPVWGARSRRTEMAPTSGLRGRPRCVRALVDAAIRRSQRDSG